LILVCFLFLINCLLGSGNKFILEVQEQDVPQTKIHRHYRNGCGIIHKNRNYPFHENACGSYYESDIKEELSKKRAVLVFFTLSHLAVYVDHFLVH